MICKRKNVPDAKDLANTLKELRGEVRSVVRQDTNGRPVQKRQESAKRLRSIERVGGCHWQSFQLCEMVTNHLNVAIISAIGLKPT